MEPPKFKLLPCIFCSIGFNFYVLLLKVASTGVNLFTRRGRVKTPQQKTSEDTTIAQEE